jgi:putative ABC transport system permease protein
VHNLRTTLSEFARDLRAQKLRTFLTVFGIVWGTVAIVVLLAFGMGFKRQMAVNMHGIGESIAIMFPGATTKAFGGFGIGRPIMLTEDDAQLLATQVPEIRRISPEFSTRDVSLRVGENVVNALVAGIYPVYGEMRNIIPGAGGRFINDPDMAQRRRVVVLGDAVKELLFGESEAIGRIVMIGEVPFTVVGVMLKKTQNSSYNRRDKDRAFIPASSFSSIYGVRYVNNIIYQPHDPTISEEVNEKVREVLGKRYTFDPADKDAIWIWDTSEFDKFMFYFFLAFNIFLGLIGSFTLAVGGIGVANIMYIVVQERVREIGVKRAVGARRSNILFQFFLETIFIVGLGSSAGFAIAVGITEALAFIPIAEYVGTPEISAEVAVATMVLLSGIGLVAGLLPARRAANLNVVECLRT